MNNKSTFLLRVIACIALLGLLGTTPSLGDPSPVGTWHHQNGKSSLQLDRHHSFLLSDTKALFELEMRGTWEADGSSVVLTPEQVRLGKVEVRAIPTGFPSTVTGRVSVASDGSRVIQLDRDEYLFVSDKADVPGPWELSPLSKEDNSLPIPFITASRGILTGLRLLPSANVQCATNAAGEVEMSITGNARVTGFGQIAIWQEGQTNYLWVADLRHRESTLSFVYAKPKSEKARQLYPAVSSVKPKRLSRDKRFFVRVDVCYTLIIPPSLGADPMYFGFEFADDGSIRRLKGLKYPDIKEPIKAWPQQPLPHVQQ
jgi:hypothetical protein